MALLVKFTEKLIRTEPLSSLLANIPDFQTEAEMESFVQQSLRSIFHLVGTVPMATRDFGGVVGRDFKVYGTINLRGVDASVIPFQMGTWPQATVYAFAEKVCQKNHYKI
ncbi:GMC oxidoreductase [Sphaerobolus stellatus SS14]|nr:GMC oxidoreductase [Sphaerobolus stellatus SS14]